MSSKALIQVKEQIIVGDQKYSQIAGSFDLIDDTIWMETVFGLLVFKVDNVAFCLLLPEDFDMSSLDSSVLVVN